MTKLSISSAVIFVLVFTQCKKNDAGTGGYVTPVTNYATPKNYLALGDSYTIGQSVQSNERFPAQTVSMLSTMGVSVNEPDYIATTGWTTDNLDHAISVNYPTKLYDVVTLLIGVNDQYQTHDTTGYRLKFARLLNTSVLLARGNNEHVVVLSIPDYSVTPFASGSDTARIRREIGWFNDINRQVTAEKGCHYLDITPSTREALTDPTLIANDGLHPSGKEYKVWAEPLSQIMFSFLR